MENRIVAVHAEVGVQDKPVGTCVVDQVQLLSAGPNPEWPSILKVCIVTQINPDITGDLGVTESILLCREEVVPSVLKQL